MAGIDELLNTMNNAAYLARIGANNTAANNKNMAGVWLPQNQQALNTATNTRNAALLAWQNNQNAANAQAYWNAERMVLAYEESVGATQDIIDGK